MDLLKQPIQPQSDRVLRPQVVQNLGVLAAEARMGGIVQPGEPNHIVILRAAETIQKFLDQPQSGGRQGAGCGGTREEGSQGAEAWDALVHLDPWSFECGFWDNLAEHPSLFEFDIGSSNVGS